MEYIPDTMSPILPGDVVDGRMVEEDTFMSIRLTGILIEQKTRFAFSCYISGPFTEQGFRMILFDIKKVGTLPLETLLTHENSDVRAIAIKRYNLETKV